MSPLLKRLAAAGLVTKHRQVDDERSVKVVLTPAGRDLRQRAEQVPHEVVRRLGMDVEELSTARGCEPGDCCRGRRLRPRSHPGIGTCPPRVTDMAESQVLEVAGREVTITNPDKVVFPDAGHTKLDLVRYYLAVADGALRGVAGRPMVLKRFVKGIDEEAFFQKRAPANRPGLDRGRRAALRAPGTSADEVVVRDAAGLAWVVNLGCIDLNPHPVRAEDLDHPDELRIDLDPVPGVDVGADRRRRRWSPGRCWTDHGLTGVAEDLRLARLPHLRAHRAALDLSARCAWRRETVAREVENRAPGPGHQPVVEGGAARRLRRLQPERQGPHGRVGVLRARRRPTPASPRR